MYSLARAVTALIASYFARAGGDARLFLRSLVKSEGWLLMIFEVTDEQIERLNDTDLRTLVGHFCEEEARLQGHSPVSVTRGGHQKVSDEGIDVRVNLQ